MFLILANHFPTQWKKAVVVLFRKKGNISSVSNYGFTSFLNTFSKVFEFVLHNDMSH
jgi:hypothetical protein